MKFTIFKEVESIDFNFFINKDLTYEEISLLLPSSFLFENSNVDTNALILLQKFGTFDEKESLFFVKMLQTEDLEEKEIFKNFIVLLKGARNKKKKALERLCKSKNFNCVIEKIILLFISQGNKSYRENLIKIIGKIYLKHKDTIFYWAEILCILIKSLDDDLLKNLSFDILTSFLIYDTNKITFLINQEINSQNSFMQKLINKILTVHIIENGYIKTLDMIDKTNNGICRFLQAHYSIFTFLGVEIKEFKLEMFDFFNKICKSRNTRFIREVGNVLSFFSLQGLLNNEESLIWFNYFFNLFKNSTSEKTNIKEEINFSINLLSICSSLSINNQVTSKLVFDSLDNISGFEISHIKIFYRICENLKYSDVENFILKNFNCFFDKKFLDFQNMILFIFKLILPNKKIENFLLTNALNEEIILKIFAKSDYIDNENLSIFFDTFFLLVKNNINLAIKNILHFGKIGKFDDKKWKKFFDLALLKINEPVEENRIIGYKIINKIIDHVDKKILKNYGNVIYEKLDKNNANFLSKQISTLAKIYEKIQFQDDNELILEIASFLKYKNDFVKYSCIKFLSVILKNKNHGNVKKVEFMRISYDVIEYLSFHYMKRKQCGIVLLTQISDIIPPQEIINIFLDFLEFNEKNVKKGLILGIAHLSDHVGIYNVLPVLLTDYKYVEDKTKLEIIRVLIKCKIPKKYISYLNPIVEDAVLNQNINFRSLGIKLCSGLLINLDRSDLDIEIFTHYLNLIWFNILEVNVVVVEEFNILIKNYTKIFGSQFLIKYVIQGLWHPSKNVRQRYLEIFKILKSNDKNTNEYLKILFEEIKN